MTDNASWAFKEAMGRLLLSYPFYQQVIDGWIEGYLPMWQSPFVINHELGHHVFFSLLPEKIKRSI